MMELAVGIDLIAQYPSWFTREPPWELQATRRKLAVGACAQPQSLRARGRYVSEGSGENIFVVRDGRILTPPLGTSVLPGITRDTVIRLAESLRIPLVETIIPREMLYIADEVFFSGTAAEITPIRSVDKIVVGTGSRGPVTEKLQRAFFELIDGKMPDRLGWLTTVNVQQPVGA